MKKIESNFSTGVTETQEIHLRDYLIVLKKRRTTIFTFLLITLLFVTIGTFSMSPIYTASTQVLIEENYGSNNIEGTYTYNRYDQSFINTQLKIITSSNVIKRAVRQLQLDSKYRNYFLDKKNNNQFLFFEFLNQKIVDLFKSISSQDPILSGDSPDDSKLLKKSEPISDAEIIVDLIKDNLSIKPEHDTKVLNIIYSHQHPGIAKLVTNFLIRSYKEELQEIKHSSSSDTLKWMTEKAELERKKLEHSEIALQAYMRKNDIITVEDKLAIYPQKLAEFSSQLSILQAERKRLESTYSQIKEAKEHSNDLETIPVIADNVVLQVIREKIYASEQNIKQLSKTYGYKNPVMISAKEELTSLRKAKEVEIKRVIDATKNAYDLAISQEKNITDLLNSTKDELLNLNEKYVQYSIMQREVNTNSILYDTLTASLKKASVTEQSQSVNVWVIEEASLPQHPSKPKKAINLLIGIVFGFLGGACLAFFFEYLDNTVKSPEEIEKRFGIKVLGAIEELTQKGQKIESLVNEEPLSPFAESYRLIRSSILLSSVDHPPRLMLITSMAPSEGKTSTTVNIARILAQSDKKVLIVDCDMRKPRQHSLFSLPNSIGLSSYLTGNTKDKIVQQVPGEDIALITAGPNPPNPAELLDSARMKKLLIQLSESYDFVLLDSPPIQSVTDSLTLSTLVDGTIIVLRSGKTTYDILSNGLNKLESINAHLLGFVLNGVSETSGGKDYYHGYYKYYSKEERKKTVN
ncbi:MAG: polysaccharide biosynthesis tyrosine autokinase [Desulfocapsa sp.]|nr:polysaccharide biosynthesis tyrosine autokinase [Desulfocapsa sp.]